MPFHPVPEANQLKPGKGMTVSIDGKRVALFNLNGRFHATADACPHVGAPLGSGWVEGKTVACPMHGWEFDIKTGKGITISSCSIETYPVRVENGTVEISID